MVRSAPQERVSNHGAANAAALSFETRRFAALLRMRAAYAAFAALLTCDCTKPAVEA